MTARLYGKLRDLEASLIGYRLGVAQPIVASLIVTPDTLPLPRVQTVSLRRAIIKRPSSSGCGNGQAALVDAVGVSWQAQQAKDRQSQCLVVECTSEYECILTAVTHGKVKANQ